MTLPLLVAVTTGLVWLLSVGVAQVQAVDAAREAARVAARGESDTAAVTLARRVAPEGARVRVRHRGDHVAVEVSAEVAGPGGLVDVVPGVRVHADAVAHDEEAPEVRP